jgi:hypothetical protein
MLFITNDLIGVYWIKISNEFNRFFLKETRESGK